MIKLEFKTRGKIITRYEVISSYSWFCLLQQNSRDQGINSLMIAHCWIMVPNFESMDLDFGTST